jgi:FAD-dependent sensor of blue light
MYHLVYLSSARQLLSDEDITDILTRSRANNERNNITGILLYHDGGILQVIEGEKSTITGLYGKLLQDHRHHNVVNVVSGESERRYFSEWCMGFKQLTGDQWKQLAGYIRPADVMTKATTSDTDVNVLVMVRSFLRVNFS